MAVQLRVSMRRLLVAILAVLVVACGTRQTLRVTEIQIGRGLNADNTVSEHTTRFSPRDTIALSVLTAGGGSGTLSVRWTYATRVLDEPKKPIAYKDVAVTDFRLQSMAGFPPGEYSAEVFLNGQSVGVRTFRVEGSTALSPAVPKRRG
jgi:hypothetical protein